MSDQASWVKLSHSSLTKSCSSMRDPASRITTLTPFCASSLPSVPPPAPEPTITTTPSSFRSNFAIVSSQLMFCAKLSSNFRQPVDVVESALDVPAMLGRGALIAELRPQLFLVVERDHEIGANRLEEIGLLDALQQRDAVGLPRHLRVGQLVAVLRILIETADAVLDERFHDRILRGL